MGLVGTVNACLIQLDMVSPCAIHASINRFQTVDDMYKQILLANPSKGCHMSGEPTSIRSVFNCS